jgi:phosphoesterase RecJ-like protein
MPIGQSDPFLNVLDILSSKRRVLVTTHVKPDGDAIGTAAAMVLAMRQKNIESQLLLFNPPPAKYAFVLEENRIPFFNIENGWPADVDLDSFDALLCVDTGTWSQLPGLKEHLAHFKSPKIVLDHHLTQENWADAKLVLTAASAAGEIAAELLRRWNVPINPPIAAVLFMAIATDTGWFQFSNTSPKTMRLAADLMEAGVDTDRIYKLAFQNERPQRLNLTARALQSLQLLADNRLAVMAISKSDFAHTGADPSDTENLINIPLQVGSVEVSLLLVESPNGGPIRASLRSKGSLDVAAFAQTFQGGGHARAAGLKMDGQLAAARQTLVQALESKLI